MPGITDLDVTYGGALAPPGFHRITHKNGGSGELNHGSAGSPSFLWYHEGANKGAPIVEIVVLHDDEPVPEGFQKISRNLLKGVDQQAYLAVRRSTDVDPIGKIHILFQDDEPAEGFEKLPRSLNPASKVYLGIQRVSKDAPAKWSGHLLKTGDWVDARDTVNKWCVAQVVDSNEETVTVHYKGWASKWDEAIPRDSPRLAELGTQTRGQDTGHNQRQQGQQSQLTAEDVQEMSRRVAACTDSAGADEHFWMGDLPHFVERGLTSSFVNLSVLPHLNRFFQQLLDVVVQELVSDREVSPNIMLMLNRLLDNDPRCTFYYNNYGYATSEDRAFSNNDFILDGVVAKLTKQNVSMFSRLFVTNVNYFGKQGGFDAIRRRLEATYNPPTSLQQLQAFLSLLRVPIGAYKEAWAREYFTEVEGIVLGRLANLRNEEIKELQDTDTDLLLWIIGELEKLLPAVLKDYPIAERAETLQLQVGKRLLICPYLSMRIKGMSILDEVVEMAKRRDTPRTYSGYTYSTRKPLPVTKWITTTWLADWLAQEDVLDVALGEPAALRRYQLDDTHVELVKRTEDLLYFLARYGKLSARHLELLWAAAVNQPDQQKRVVYKIVAGIAPALDAELLEFVGKRVHEAMASQPDELYVELVRGLAEGAYSNAGPAGDTVDYGLTTLWSIAQDSTNVRENVRNLAAEAVAAVLSNPSAKRQLQQYSEQCIGQITARQSPAFFISLLQKLLDALLDVPSHANPMVTKEQLINYMQEHHNLMHVLIADIVAFLDDVRQRTVKDGTSIVEQGFTYRSALDVRLAFLRFVLESSPLELRLSEVKLLWAALVNDPVTPADPNTFIAWLATICPEEYLHVQRRVGVYPCLSDEVVFDIFNHLLGGGILSDEDSGQLTCPFEKLNEDGYLCLEKFFRYVCGRQKRMQHSYNKLYFTVEVAELPGFEVILEAFLRTTSEAVAKVASEFIVNLQLKLSPRLSRRQVWESFTTTCMELAQKDVSDQYRNRVLIILTKFLQEIKKPQPQTASYVTSAGAGKTDEHRLNVFWRKETPNQAANVPGSRTVGYTFKRGTVTLGALRTRVARDLKHPVQQVRLLNSQRLSIPNSQDNLTLEQARVSSYIDAILLLKPEDDTRNYVAVAPATTVEEDPNSDQMFPRKILSDDPACLALLFEMLSNPVVMDSAWNLLELLPTNTAMKEEIATMGGALNGDLSAVRWTELLDGSRPLWLLYKLRIVSDIISPLITEGAAATEQQKAKEWCTAFVQSGGVQHLLSTLVSVDVERMCAGTLTKNCLAVLLQLITQFLLPEDDADDDSDVELPTPVAIAEKEAVGSDIDDVDVVAVSAVAVATPAKPVLRRPNAEVVRTLSLDIDVVDIIEPSQVTTIIRQLLAILHEISISIDKPAALDDDHAKDSQRRNRQARIEEYYRNQATQGAQTSTATDMINWDDDDEDADARHVELSLEAQVVRHAMSLLVTMTLNQPSVRDAVLQYPDLSGTLMYSLVKSPESSLRNVVARGIVRLCERVEKDGQPPAQRFLALLMPGLPTARAFPQSCYEYFALLAKLIVMPGAVEAVDPEQLARDLANQIVSHPVVEASEEEEDFLLRGTMLLLQNVLSVIPAASQAAVKQNIGADLVEEVFNQCLFSIPQRGHSGGASLHPPKCKHPRTRAAAFALLAELANRCESNFKAIVALVDEHHSLRAPMRKSTKQSSVSLSSSYLFAKSKTGYAGLKNLGCICYMNSALQQFFMVPDFRQGVLNIEPSTDSDTPKEEDVLAQLQDIFAHLQETEKAYFDPKGFCNAFKDWEGNPVDVLVQQDASEFLTMFFQNVEGLTMGSKSENLLKDCFGGTLCNELIAEGGKHSERGEPFFFISVPVQGNKTLYDALEQYTAGEMVDYTWETNDENGQVVKQSLPTTKRVTIKTPPKHLIIHLKRFEFDFETMQQIKVNDRFEFPLELDLYPYTRDGKAAVDPESSEAGDAGERDIGQPVPGADAEAEEAGDMVREYFKYELAGVVVHMGTANSGHYYSYIRERAGEQRGWFEFNDTYVGEFDPADIEEECFGGEEPVTYGYRAATGASTGYPGQSSQAYTRQKIRNAFMLVYDRVAIKDDTESKENNAQAPVTRYRANIPAHIMDELYEENLEFWRVKNIYDQRYYDFMQRLLTLDVAVQRAGTLPSVDVVALACKFALGTLVHARERMLLYQWTERLSPILANHGPASEWLLETLNADPRLLQDLLVGVTDKEVQASVMTLLPSAIQALLPEIDKPERSSKPTALRFADSVIALLPVMQQQWRYISLTFRPLVSLAEQSTAARRYMLEEGYLARLFSFFLCPDSPYPELVTGPGVPASKPKPMSDNYSTADHSSTLQLMSALMANCAFRDADPAVHASIPQPHYQPSDIEVEMSSLPLFLYRLIREIRNARRRHLVAPIIERLIAGREPISTALIDVIVSCMKKDDGLDLKLPLRAAICMVEVRDGQEVRRVDSLMAAIVAEARENVKFVTATEVTAIMLSRLAKASPHVRAWMKKSASSLTWLETFLQQRKQNLYPQGAMLAKPRRYQTTSSSQTYSQQQQYAQNSRYIMHKVGGLLKQAMQGAALGDSYDSDDDPSTLVGKRIRVRWSQEKYYAGVVSSYDPATHAHRVSYDDGDTRDYVMSEKVWRFESDAGLNV